MFFHQFGVKTVVARGHGSVSREHYFPRDPGHGLIKAESLILHAAVDRFQNGKPAMAFVEVQNSRSDAHGAERAEASHTQKQFLANTNAGITAVETRSELAVLRMIAFNVGIEKE